MEGNLDRDVLIEPDQDVYMFNFLPEFHKSVHQLEELLFGCLTDLATKYSEVMTLINVILKQTEEWSNSEFVLYRLMHFSEIETLGLEGKLQELQRVSSQFLNDAIENFSENILKVKSNDCLNPNDLKDPLNKFKCSVDQNAFLKTIQGCILFRGRLYILVLASHLLNNDFKEAQNEIKHLHEDMRKFEEIMKDSLQENHNNSRKCLCLILITFLVLVTTSVAIAIVMIMFEGRHQIPGRYAVIVVGGYDKHDNDDTSRVEILQDNKDANCHVPHFPMKTGTGPVMFQHKKIIYLCGGYPTNRECWKLVDKKWVLSSNKLKRDRREATSVTMNNGIYILGSNTYNSNNSNSSEFLSKDSDHWVNGPPLGFASFRNCAVKITEDTLVLIGRRNYKNIRAYALLNTTSKEWSNKGVLGAPPTYPRSRHKCDVFNKKIIVTGGRGLGPDDTEKTTDIIDISQTQWQYRRGGNMTFGRFSHGMAIIDLDGKSTLCVFGGESDIVEIWDDKSETWSTTNKLRFFERRDFGYVTVEKEVLNC